MRGGEEKSKVESKVERKVERNKGLKKKNPPHIFFDDSAMSIPSESAKQNTTSKSKAPKTRKDGKMAADAVNMNKIPIEITNQENAARVYRCPSGVNAENSYLFQKEWALTKTYSNDFFHTLLPLLF